MNLESALKGAGFFCLPKAETCLFEKEIFASPIDRCIINEPFKKIPVKRKFAIAKLGFS